MKKIIASILFSMSLLVSNAQISKITPADLVQMRLYQDTLRMLGDSLAYSKDWSIREHAAVQMVRTLVKTLKPDNSFYYPLDSQMMITTLYPENQEFRIFTFPLKLKDNTYRYYGAIQMRNARLTLFPMIDMSLFIENPQTTTLNCDNWYGAYYYNIKEIKTKEQHYYLLFGWDGVDDFTTRKITDIMWFNDAGIPQFGLPVFAVSDTEIKQRVFIEYKDDASPTFNYDEEYEMIIYDYLRPENPMSEGIYMTYIPDGTYQGYKLDKKTNMWVFQEKVFDHILDKPPLNKPKYKGEDPNMYIKPDN
ncbi:MAG: hypothetical protein IPG60_12280 [Bacteroidetes bacterium]|nr:hypothetical protein [Bacteroidota bacterium]MBP7399313.1 hypothetical protein [Chitinophagales bacterium]MBP9189844.1 hypothetical protein [Chitinophagales bacterium]MBP9548021.1 hypothetical protein [Chitinophagales bacterium]MBP9704672.1 hypothetical protein [Chitinophagales bacterium]